MNFISYRQLNFTGLCLVIVILTFAFYLQIHLGILPCPLCIIQRFLFALLGIMFFVGAIYHPRRTARILYCGLIFIIALLGILMASRQIWLQHLPMGKAPPCGPGLYYILSNWSISDAMKIIFQGTADCAEITWTLLNLSIAEWSLIFFILFAIIAFVQVARR